MNNKSSSLTSGNFYKNIIIFVIPIILSAFLIQSFELADLVICNAYTEGNTTGAISATSSLVHCFQNLIIGVSVGVQIQIAKAVGQKSKGACSALISNGLISSLALSLIIAAFAFSFSKPILIALKTPSDIFDNALTYFRIVIPSIAFLSISESVSAFYKANGDSKTCLYVYASSGFLNLGLNILFTAGMHLGVAGVAIATTISRFAACVTFLILLRKNKFDISFKIKELSFDWNTSKSILLVGLPAGIQAALFSFVNLFLQRKVNLFGSAAVSGRGAANSINVYIDGASNSLNTAAVSFFSANYGCKNFKNIKKTRFIFLLYSFLIIFGLSSIIYIFRKPILGLFVKTPEEILYGEKVILIINVFYFFYCFSCIYVSLIRVYNHSILSSIIVLVTIAFFRIVWMYGVCSSDLMNTFENNIMCYPISYFLTLIVAISFSLRFERKLTRTPESDGVI